MRSQRSQSLRERVLHEFLRVLTVSGHEVHRAVQALVMIEEELVEADRDGGRLASSPHFHGPSLAPHGSWMRRSRPSFTQELDRRRCTPRPYAERPKARREAGPSGCGGEV